MELQEFLNEWNNNSQFISVETSGSTGTPKTLLVEKEKMIASARMTCQFLRLKPHDKALLCMSLKHIGAKMMVVRSLIANLDLLVTPPSKNPLADITEPLNFVAMVPLQVYNSMQNPIEYERLKNIEKLIIGGGEIDKNLETNLTNFPNEVWSTYGMTETLSHIAMRRVNGPNASKWYQPLPNIKISTLSDGCLIIDAPHLSEETIVTNDIVEINANNEFKILGRKDNVINSGGIKIQIEEVEKVVGKHLNNSFTITGKKDIMYGEIVVLYYTPSAHFSQEILTAINNELPKYHKIKEAICIEEIPLTSNGKIDRGSLRNK
ncbi:MAG: AMP-binding protein [Paludibacteraceae bacterium]|nr:AMP-binding protein [Paludibacteraceae bacterium]